MEIRYKKVIVLYAVLALVGILAVRNLVVRPLSALYDVHVLRGEVENMRMKAQIVNPTMAINAVDATESVRGLMLSVLDCLGTSGCCVLTGIPSKKKSPDDCPVFDIKLAFTGRYQDICEALSSVDSLLCGRGFDAGVQTCSIGAERSQDGRSWQLICRETLQCLPTMPPSDVIMDGSENLSFGIDPFYLPSIPVPLASGNDREANSSYQITRGREAPQGRLVGRISTGGKCIVIADVGGQTMHLHKGDGILLRDFGDSVKMLFGVNDTLVLRKK